MTMGDIDDAENRSQWRRGIVVALVLYAGGFFLFTVNVRRAEVPADGLRADAIVALTGDEGRLGPAVELLEQGKGERLLITGVYPKTTKTELKKLLRGGTRFDCCADLGFQAADTRGNAREAHDWAQAHGYKSLIIVTANYHMPRSHLEFAAAMPNVTLTNYPVGDDEPSPRWRVWRRWFGEYGKFLAAHVWIAFNRIFASK